MVETVLESILQALREGSRVEIRRFGTFAIRQRGGRMGLNPKTGERVVVGPKKIAFFKREPSPTLKNPVSGAVSFKALNHIRKTRAGEQGVRAFLPQPSARIR